MNIFYLNQNPKIAAQQHCDKHVVKMILETAQLLSTAHRVLDGYDGNDLYKATHKNHPSAIWARQSESNYNWLYDLFIELQTEYTYRYKRIHASSRLNALLAFPPKNIPIGEFTEPPVCMPDEYKLGSTIESYWNYYIKAKYKFCKWTSRIPPAWFKVC